MTERDRLVARLQELAEKLWPVFAGESDTVVVGTLLSMLLATALNDPKCRDQLRTGMSSTLGAIDALGNLTGEAAYAVALGHASIGRTPGDTVH